ncbi:predicted protein [Botrytis cinerea T4]|uniref:Uncharacterized protein n=1 Tax=Botryotinia fuckeliana (strain T4) TaxID=999810 RepID=G2YLE6_BOTF4|nr:predicted protein [Botrytis cinerea T4]
MCAFYNINFYFTIVFPSSNASKRVHTKKERKTSS